MKKYTVVFLLTALGLFPLFLLAAYNHPTDDDYCTYQLFHNRSSWEAFTYGYNNFSGRFSYLLLFSQWDPLYNSEWLLLTRLWPPLTLAAFLLTVRLMLRIALGNTSSKEQWVAWGVLTTVLLAGWPSIASSFYWFTGATVYTLAALCASASLIALFASLQPQATSKRILLLIGSCGLALVAVGSNEVLIMFLLFFVLILMVWIKHETFKFEISIIVFLLVIAGGAYVALSAPGNFKRASDMLHRAADLSYVMQVGIKCVYLVTLKVGSWLSQVPLWLTGLLIAAVARPLNFSWLAPRNRVQLAIMALLLFAVMIAMVFLSCYAYNDIIPRVWNLVYFYFVFAFLYVIIFLVRLFPAAEPVVAFVRSRWSALAVATVLFCLVSSGSNLTTAWGDLFFKAKEYNTGMLKRYEVIKAAKASGQRTAVIEPLFLHRYQYPRTLFLNDIGTESNEFPNTCLSYYFGLDSIRLSCCQQESRHLE